MALALVSKFENSDLWQRTMATEIPGLDFRVWPDLRSSISPIPHGDIDACVVPPWHRRELVSGCCRGNGEGEAATARRAPGGSMP
jgi:hypothetical protein